MSCRPPIFRAILVDFFPLLSIFGHDSLSQPESPTSGGLGFVVLDVHCSGKDGKIDRSLLLLHSYRLKLSACLYDKYLARYAFSKIFKSFLSRSCHPELRRFTESLTRLPYLNTSPCLLILLVWSLCNEDRFLP